MIKQRFSKLWHSSFFRSVAVLFSGNGIAQLVRLLVYPILGRIYAPSDFGLFSFFVSISGLLVTLANAEYYNAILLPKHEKEASNLINLQLLTSTTITLLAALCIPLAHPLALRLGHAELAPFFYLFPFSVWFMSLWRSLHFWFIRQKFFKRIAYYQIVDAITNAGGKTTLGLLGFTHIGLILSYVLGPLIGVVSLFIAFPSLVRDFFAQHFSWQAIKSVGKTYKNFPIFALPTSFINTLSIGLPVLTLIPYFGAEAVGFYAMALSISLTPINTFSSSLYQVYYQKFTHLCHTKESCRPDYHRFIRLSLLIEVPGFIALYFLMPFLVHLVLGPGWEETSTLIRLLLPWILAICLVKVMSFIPDLFFLQKYAMYIEILYLALRAFALGIGIYFESITLAIFLFGLVSTLIIIGQLLWFNAILKKQAVLRPF